MLKTYAICLKSPCNLPQIITCFGADSRVFCIKLQYVMNKMAC